MSSTVSIIIVSFNTKDLLINLINSIKKTTKAKYELIVVDNSSTDGTQSALKKIKEVKFIENKTNVGFSTANNQGVRISTGEYILFLNPDMVAYNNSIDGVLKYMQKNSKVGAATCFVKLPNGSLDDASHRGFPTPFRALSHFLMLGKLFPKSKLFSGYSLGYKNIKTIHEIDSLAGAYMMVRRKAGEEISWWDEQFFWYGEDIDFCYRLKQNGWKIMFIPNFKILHYKGASGGIKKTTLHLTNASSETKKRSQEERYKAMKIFYNKHYKNKYPKIINKIVFLTIDVKKCFLLYEDWNRCKTLERKWCRKIHQKSHKKFSN